MSAYMVDREHIVYLVKAAVGSRDSHFWWTHNGQTNRIVRSGLPEDDERLVSIANMLWRENVKSVQARYQDKGEGNLPGRIGETYWITMGDMRFIWPGFDAVQVLKACDCYEYQSCEHEGWESSDAKAFVDALRHKWIAILPRYDDAIWGAPEPMHNSRNMVRTV